LREQANNVDDALDKLTNTIRRNTRISSHRSYQLFFKSFGRLVQRSGTDNLTKHQHYPEASTSSSASPAQAQKTTRLDRKCLNLKVVIQASSRALRPPFWSSRLPSTVLELSGHRSGALGVPGLFQSSQACSKRSWRIQRCRQGYPS
jgi:hypothetical protein